MRLVLYLFLYVVGPLLIMSIFSVRRSRHCAVAALLLWIGGIGVGLAQVRPLSVTPLHNVEQGVDWNSYFTVSNTGSDARVLVWVAGKTLKESLGESGSRAFLEDPVLTVDRLECIDPSDALTCQQIESYVNDDWGNLPTTDPRFQFRLRDNIGEVLSGLLQKPLEDKDSALLLDLPLGLYRVRVRAQENSEGGLAELNVYEFASDADYSQDINGAYLSGILDEDGNVLSGTFTFVEARENGWIYRWSDERNYGENPLSKLGLPSHLINVPATSTFAVNDSDAVNDSEELSFATSFKVLETGAPARVLLWATGRSISVALDEYAAGIHDPVLTLYDCRDKEQGCISIAENDDFGTQTESSDAQWQVFGNEEVEAALASVFGDSISLEAKESAMLVALPAGDYRVGVKNRAGNGAAGLSRIGIVEFGADVRMDGDVMRIFDLDIGTIKPDIWDVDLTYEADDKYRLTYADDVKEEDNTIPVADEEDPVFPNLNGGDVSTWTTCYAKKDDLSKGPIYEPPEDDLEEKNWWPSDCVGKIKIVDPQREFDLASCSANPFASIYDCFQTGSFDGDEVYAIRMRIGDLTGKPSISTVVDTSIAHSDHSLVVFALSDTPGKFDVDDSRCRSDGAIFSSAIAMTTDQSLDRYGYCIVPKDKVSYLNVRFVDYSTPSNDARVSSCGTKNFRDNYSYRCDVRIQTLAFRDDFAFDRVAVPQGTFTAAEGQWVHIPVELLGGLDNYAAVDFDVVGGIGADASDFMLQAGYGAGDKGAHRLSWSYADDAQRTKYISLYIHADGSAESVESLKVYIRPVHVYLDDGAGTHGTEMSSGEYLVQISIAANGT
jgi:hypothetical protein